MANAKPKKIHGIKMIRDDEYEVFSTHASLVPTILRGFPILLLGVLVTVIAHLWRHDTHLTMIVGAVACLILVLSRVPGCLRALVEPIVVSNRRLYLRKGFVDIDDHIATLSNISDIQVDPTILGRLFGYADVNIQTIAGEQDFEMKNVRKAYTLRDHILRISDDSNAGQGTPAYDAQGGYQQQGYPQQGGYPQQNGYPQQGGRQGYPQQGAPQQRPQGNGRGGRR